MGMLLYGYSQESSARDTIVGREGSFFGQTQQPQCAELPEGRHQSWWYHPRTTLLPPSASSASSWLSTTGPRGRRGETPTGKNEKTGEDRLAAIFWRNALMWAGWIHLGLVQFVILRSKALKFTNTDGIGRDLLQPWWHIKARFPVMQATSIVPER